MVSKDFGHPRFCGSTVFHVTNVCIYIFFHYAPSTVNHLFISFGLQVQKLSKNEVMMVNIGSLSTGGRVSAVKADLAKIVLTNPVCTEVGEKIALSRRVEKHWR